MHDPRLRRTHPWHDPRGSYARCRLPGRRIFDYRRFGRALMVYLAALVRRCQGEGESHQTLAPRRARGHKLATAAKPVAHSKDSTVQPGAPAVYPAASPSTTGVCHNHADESESGRMPALVTRVLRPGVCPREPRVVVWLPEYSNSVACTVSSSAPVVTFAGSQGLVHDMPVFLESNQ